MAQLPNAHPFGANGCAQYQRDLSESSGQIHTGRTVPSPFKRNSLIVLYTGSCDDTVRYAYNEGRRWA